VNFRIFARSGDEIREVLFRSGDEIDERGDTSYLYSNSLELFVVMKAPVEVLSNPKHASFKES
jgi:hypothetical protein